MSISYPGASAQTVADTVAAPIEQQVNGVPGHAVPVQPDSGNDGSYSLTVTFEIGTDLNTALVVVQNRVQLALPVLPSAVQLQGITVRKRTPDILASHQPDLPRRPVRHPVPEQLRHHQPAGRGAAAGRALSDVTVFGQRDYSMRAWLDPAEAGRPRA